MRTKLFITTLLVFFILIVVHLNGVACSTFKLQKGDSLVYGHNLNEGDIGVPGMVFINKRGTFKVGRTWSELTTPDQQNSSGYCWISRYGSVTFNCFARDFPDGGMNEAGLFIWEMNEDADYPKDERLPKLDQMQWMQYILDNYSTTEEAIKCASEIEISGWGWHFFVGDASGNTAAIAFIDGEVVVYKNENMPVPALFNTPYQREMELLKYYKPHGGLYEADLDDPNVPRFVKTDVLIKNYDTSENIVDYGLMMLDKIQVFDVPEWSILFDVRNKNVYFKTRLHPEVKSFSMSDIDFTNKTPVQIMNMDYKTGGDVKAQFASFSTEKMGDFFRNSLQPVLPEAFFTRAGLSLEEVFNNLSTHTLVAQNADKQFFNGVWKSKPEKDDGVVMMIGLKTNSDAVECIFSNSKEIYPVDHLRLMGEKLEFTIKTSKNVLLEVKATLGEDKMEVELSGTENYYGSEFYYKQM